MTDVASIETAPRASGGPIEVCSRVGRSSTNQWVHRLGVAATLLLLAGCAGSGQSPSLATPGSGTLPADAAIASAPAQAPAAPAPIARPSARIALLLPLSGVSDTAAVAKGLKQASELALFEINSPSFELVVKDTAGTAEGARSAAQAAVAEGAELIIGPLFASSVESVTPIARAAGVPVMAFSNDRRVAGQGVYLLSFMIHEEVERVVSYAAGQGKRRFAALVSSDSYGQIAEQAFRAAVQRHGGTIVASERYPPNANGMVEPTQRLFELVRAAGDSGAPVDAIFIPGGPDTLPRLGPLITYAKLDTNAVKLLGTGGWDYPNLSREAAFVGAWYPSPDPRGWQAFSERFAKTFGSAPPRIASFAYDAVTIAATLSTAGPKGTRFTPAALTQSRGFSGVDGPVRFTAGGTTERGLAVVEVGPFTTRVIDPAQQGFAATATTATALVSGASATGALASRPQ